MGLEDIDRYGFPNIGNSPFYTTEFNIASMLPQIEVSGPILRKTMFHTGNEIINTDEEIENEDDDSIIHINEAANYSNINKYPVFIILQHSGTLMANAIKMMTHHEYTRVCISFSSKMSPMYTFGNKKATTVGAKAGYVIQSPKDDFYKNYKVKYAVYVMYVSENEYKQMKKSLAAFNKVKDSWKYDFGNLIKLYTGISSEESNKYFCSKFVAKIINDGHRLDKVPSLWFPNDFTSLDNISLVNSGDDFSQYDYRVTEANLDMIKGRKVTEACKDTLHARKFINEVKVLAKRYNANYFIVTDSASEYFNSVGNGVHNPAVDNARDKQIEWEKNNGFDPYENWSKPRIIYESISFNQIITNNSSINIKESVLISKDDILYKKEEFNSGEINLAFVFGFSGSGKSTMGRDVSGNSIDCDHIELDDVMTNWNFSDDNLKEYSSLLSDFFKGPGKKYRVSQDKLIQDHVSEENYEIPLLKDFIKFAKTYTKSYKNKKFILDGIWPLLYDIQPSEFKDYAVFLKGTSFITSYIRAFKRDKKKLSRVFKDFTDTSFNKCSRKIISNLNKYMNYFTNLEKTIDESVKLKRSELPDEVFGIPQERKYPMPDKKHTISAIKLFNHVDKKYEKQLANAILANVNKYGIDVSFVSDKNRFKKYLDEIEERTEDDMFNSTIVDDMMREFICESNDPDIPDEIEGIVKILESKGYKVRYASPGHDNTRFYNDRNKDRIINAKLQTTARIIFERDYKFPNTPQGWKWKVLNDRDDKALYVKPYTYNEERMGSPKEAFEKWKRFYLSNLRTWAEDLSRVGHTDNDAPDYNF